MPSNLNPSVSGHFLIYPAKRLFRIFTILCGLTLWAPAFADVTLEGIGGGDVITAYLPVTLPSRDFFTVSVDSGSNGSPAPAWLTATPLDGYTDAQVQISADPSVLPPGNSIGRIVLMFPNGEPTVTQMVTLHITSGGPTLEVVPAAITLDGVNGDFIPVSAPVFVRNAGGEGPQQFTATLTGNAPFLTLTNISNQTSQNSPALTIQDTGTPHAQTGTYSATLHVSSGNQTIDVPVTFLAKSDLLFFSLTKSGLLFDAQQGVGTPLTQTVGIKDASGPVAWTASVSSAQDFLTLSPANGTVTPGATDLLTIGVKPLNTPGVYYAMVTVTPTVFTDSISPVLLTVVYNVTSIPPLPDLAPAGLIFTSSATTPPAPQNISIAASSTTSQPYEVGFAGNFIGIPAPIGSASGNSLTPVAVNIDPSGLKPGIYRGAVQFNFPQLKTFRTADVLEVVPQSATASPGRNSVTSPAACTPSQIAVIGTSIAGNFSQPAGWPAVFEAHVVDDCANPVNTADVILGFSNGDPALRAELEACGQEQGCSGSGGNGTYSATWVPHNTGPATVTVRATSGTLSASAVYSGTVPANVVPFVPPNGTVNNSYVQSEAPLAPGTVTAIYGSGLTSGMGGSPPEVPLPDTFQGTSILIGNQRAPIYFTSSGQLVVQLPSELQPNQTYSLLVNVNGALSVPQSVTVGSTTPGVVAFSDGRLIAQHADAHATLVSTTHPAKAGETLVMYLVGMGATNPPVKSGTAAPGIEPLARVVNMNMPVVTVDGNPAKVTYAGLTPFSVGLYQIDFTVPKAARTGNLTVVIMQNGTVANATTLPVIAK